MAGTGYRIVVRGRLSERGRAADEVCAELGITDGNQRVVLHRACAKVRQALEDRPGAEEA
jgi:DNA-directed RNA polymerase specialized sigma24 family protein